MTPARLANTRGLVPSGRPTCPMEQVAAAVTEALVGVHGKVVPTG